MGSRTAKRRKNMLTRALRQLDAELTGNSGTNIQGTGKRCKVCGRGIILSETRLVLDAASVLAGNGRRGGQPLYRRVTSYHCGECGVMYATLPRD